MTVTKTIEQQVEEACAPLRMFITRAHKTNGSVFWNPIVETYIYGTSTHHTARLRVDYELTDEERENTSVANGILDCLQPDLVDLLRNGDVNKGSDVLLKTIDGASVRGVDAPEWIQISEAIFYHQYMPKKESTEYTLYILLAVSWPEKSTK